MAAGASRIDSWRRRTPRRARCGWRTGLTRCIAIRSVSWSCAATSSERKMAPVCALHRSDAAAGVDCQKLAGDLLRFQQRDNAGRHLLGRQRRAERALLAIGRFGPGVLVAEALLEPPCFGEPWKHGVHPDFRPKSAGKSERERVQRALEQAYATEEPIPRVPAIDETLTTAPRAVRNGPSQARIIWYAAIRLTEKIR